MSAARKAAAAASLALCLAGCAGVQARQPASPQPMLLAADVEDDETRPYVIAVLAEGYGAGNVANGTGNQGDFPGDVDFTVRRALLYEPFASNKANFEIRPIPVVSADLGVAGENQTRNTAFKVKYHGRKADCYFTVSSDAASAISKRARESGDVDFIVVLVNAGVVNGVGCSIKDKIALVTRGSSHATMAHELGHTIADLYDEYPAGKPGTPTIRSGNCTSDRDQTVAPWRGLIKQTVAVPTARNAGIPVAMYEGCAHYDTGVFRPTVQCMMDKPPANFCVWCKSLLMTVVKTLPKESLALHPRFRFVIPAVPAGETPEPIEIDQWLSPLPPRSGPQPLHNLWLLTYGDRVIGSAATDGPSATWRAYEDAADQVDIMVPAPFEIVDVVVPRSGLLAPFDPDVVPELRLYSFPERVEMTPPLDATNLPPGFPAAKTVATSPQLTNAIRSLLQ